MADPLSISVSVIALLQLTGTVISYLKDICDCPQDRIDFLSELSGLPSLLKVLQKRVEDAKSGDPWLTGLEALIVTDGPLDRFKTDLDRLASKLKSADGPKGIVQKLTWKFEKSEIKNIISRIERIKSLVMLALTNDLLSLSRSIKEDSVVVKENVLDIKGDVLAIRRDFSDAQKDGQVDAIVQWLSPLDFKMSQDEIFQRREEGTGQWLLQSEEYIDWRDRVSTILWCPGMPGAGKTFLASIVIHDLQTCFTGTNTAILCIYCNYKEQIQQSVSNLIASLLKQIVQDRRTASDSLYQLYKEKYHRPTLSELMNILKSESKTFSRVFIVVDALDECPDDGDTRADLIQALRSLSGNVSLMVTSRDIPSIAQEFKGMKHLPIYARESDVLRYVEGRISCCRRRHLTALREDVVNKVVENAKGMFLLARLHMDSLESKPSVSATRKALENLPKKMDDTYDEAMDRIEQQNEDDRELANQVLSWVTHAYRPLLTEELQHALATHTADMTNLDYDAIIDAELLTSVCAGLVVIDQENGVVRVVHFTAQEYFERKRGCLFPNAQANIAMACLRYLSFDIFKITHPILDWEAIIKGHILSTYTAQHWGHHARGEAEEISREMIQRFLHHPQHLKSARQVLQNSNAWRLRALAYAADNPNYFSGVHVLAYFGLEKNIQYHLKNEINADSADVHGHTPLSLAAQRGHDAVARQLLERDDVREDSKDCNGRTPLSWAATGGHEAVVRLLIAQDNVNMNSTNESGQTPLSLAARNGHEEVVRLLMAHPNINLNSRDMYSRTPLYYAANKGHKNVVSLLMAHDGIDVNSEDEFGRTQLSLAASKGHEEVVRLLVAHPDVNMNSCDMDGQTPLSHAAENGHEGVIRLLTRRESCCIERCV